MPFEHTFPGQPLAIKSSDWNAAMDAARAVAGGETGLRARTLQGQDSNNIVLVKNTSGGDLARFAVVDIDEAVFSADDNENGYKGGPDLIATGHPIAGRLAFCGVVQEPIADGKFGRVALSGVTVGYVVGTGAFAWPVSGDLEAFETRDTGGFPVYDRGTADEDGYSLATILLTPVTDAGDAGAPGYPPNADLGCHCSDCADGTGNHECEDCGCVNRRRAVSMPDLVLANGEPWIEPRDIAFVTYLENCLWVSQTIDGPTCTDDEDVEHSDSYRLEVDYTAGTAEIVRVSGENCDLISMKWCLSSNCAKKCLCSWVFDVSEFNGFEHPRYCKLCVTPVSRSQHQTSCNGCIFDVPDQVTATIGGLPDLTFFDPADIGGLAAEMDMNGSYELVLGDGAGGTPLASGDATCIETSGVGSSCDGWGYTIDDDRHLGVIEAEIFYVGPDSYVVFAVVLFGSTPSTLYCLAHYETEPMTCAEITEWLTQASHDMPLVAYHPDLPAAPSLSLNIKQARATSSGHVGSLCGDSCATEECWLEVVEYAGSNRWITSGDSTCTGACENNCDPGCSVFHPICGDASDFEPGYKCFAGDCISFSEVPGTVTAIFEESGSCSCGAMAIQMCLNVVNGKYEATIDLCGGRYDIEYYEDGGVWYFSIGGAIDSDASPSGPFVTSFMEDDPLCEGISVTVA